MKPGIVVFALCLALLGGCATQPKAPQPINAQAAWQERQNKFAQMSSWHLQGRVGMQFRDQSAVFNLSWLQQGKDRYTMNIKNPLTGSAIAYLQGTPGNITLQVNGKTYRDANAERLLQSQLGVSLPLEGMKYWVRGVPSPDSPLDRLKLGAQGLPEKLQQAGWQVSYLAWQGNGWNALPEKISLIHEVENTKVKVIVKEWQTRY